MELLKDNKVKKITQPIKVIQFGEGNFLRGFVDYMFDIANERNLFNGDIVIIKPIEYGNLESFHQQDCRYTVSLRGRVNGKEQVSNRIITSVAEALDAYQDYDRYANLAKLDTLRFVVSNTTEAGIVYDETDQIELCPPKSYPGKLTKFLYERYSHFQGDIGKGLIILPVELIDDNGIRLKDAVLKLTKLWGLEKTFAAWLKGACVFCSTLVDRIVTGYPKEEEGCMWEEFGYIDHLIVTGEPFALWVIESEKSIEMELPLKEAGLPVIFTDNQKPYKQRKVRILNGAHTSFVLASYLAGNDYVLESMQDVDIREYMLKTIYDEIIPTLDLPKEDLISFAEAVLDRFQNPFIKHSLLSISLNSVSKWRARCMPSLLEYVKRYEKLPSHLTFSLAALMKFYSGRDLMEGALIGHRGQDDYKIMDDKEVLEFFAKNVNDGHYEDPNEKHYDEDHKKHYEEDHEKLYEEVHDDHHDVVNKFLSKKSFWGQDLTEIVNLEETINEYWNDIKTLGMREAIRKLIYS